MMLRPIIKNKKGQSMLDVVIFIVIAIIIIVLFGLLRYGIGIINTTLAGIETPANSLGINISDTSAKTFGNLNAGMISLKVVGICLIFGMILTIFLSNFLVKAHPVFFVGYVLISIIAVVFAILITNGYINMLKDSSLSAIFSEDAIGNFIILNLPIWVTVISFVGAILLFAGINKDEGMGGGLG